VIITRTPLRISLGGGGTDLPSYYRQHGGMVMAGAINKYMFVSLNNTFTDDYLLKYSALERVRDISEIEHPIIREALRLHAVAPAIEVVSVADIPAGTGLGSSGTFTVGLLRAIHAHVRKPVPSQALAEEACRIEIETLGRPAGKQDQYIAAYGGLTCFEFGADDRVEVSPVALSDETLYRLEEHLVMFFTGYARAADLMLADQRERSERGEAAMIENLHMVKELGYASKEALEIGDTDGFAALMHEHWLHKRERSAGMTNPDIDRWYELGMSSGALGGKLVGAGAGGFLLFYAKDPSSLRHALAAEGLNEVRFGFDHDGSTILARG
jgi:D-glycero-alpha-D-manno-heptose-7-phosphate kinase